MNTTTVPLELDRYYHIYNRGINGCNLFWEDKNYLHFLELYAKYISVVADTFAWVLMKNHFHLLIRIYSEVEIADISFSSKKKYTPSLQFSHLFNAYSKWFNTRYQRTGKLFETPFRRIQIFDEIYFKHLIFYIHNNPVHHHFTDSMFDYPWSSYLTILSLNPTKLNREKVFGWFNSRSEFETFHRTKQNEIDFSDFLFNF